MSAPFVISMKIVGDGSSAVATTDAVVQGLDHVGDAMDAQRVRALELVQAEKEIVRLGREMVNIPAVSKVQTGINQVTGVGQPGRGTAQAAADIEAYGRQMDDLRAKYNPLFAAERAHEEIIRDIQRAYRVGAISSDEMAAAIAREAKAHELLTQRIQQETGAKQQNNSTGLQTFNTANAAAQFQDVAVTAAMGMNPLQIALQQGTQLSMVLQSSLGDKGAGGAAKLLFSSLMSLASPVSLLTIGLVALGAVGIQAFMGMANSSSEAEDALERHNKLLDDILQGYDKARQAAKTAADETLRLPAGSVRSNLAAQLAADEGALAKANQAVAEATLAKRLTLVDYLETASDSMDKAHAQAAAMMELQRSFADGTLSAEDFHTELTKLKNNSADEAISEVVTWMLELVDAARKADAQVSSVRASLAELRFQPAINVFDRSMDATTAAIERLKGLAPDLRDGYAKARDVLAEAMRSAPTEVLRFAAQEQYQRTIKALDEQKALEASKSAESAVAGERSRLSAMRESISAAQLDLEIIGKSAEETERLRFVRQNLAAAEQAAAQAGTTVSAAYRAEIEKLGAAYGSLRSQVQIYSMAQDLAFERAQLGRSDLEQKVASQLRPIFGEDLTSSQAQFLAQQIRINETLKETDAFGQQLTRGFFADLNSNLRNGSSLFEALGTAGANALDKLAEKALNAAADGLWDMLFGAFSGALTGGFKPATGYVPSFGAYGQYETGGWTGGTRGRFAGVVHGEEFVVKAGPAAANRAVLEAMNSGAPIGGGSSVTFAPVNQFSVTGGEADIPTYERMLDERDRRLTSQFQDLVEAHLENPMRKWR